MRAGGGGGMAAAREFVRLAQSGQVSSAEVREAQKVIIGNPELRDAFQGVARELSQLVGGDSVFRDVSSLSPDTERLTDARTMPERFLADLKLVEQQLLNHPGMTRAQKAQRLFQFFETYAARFQQLAHGVAQDQQAATAQPPGALNVTETGLQLAEPLTSPEFTKALAQFDKALERAGFPHLTAGDGRTGMAAAREMLEARTPEELAAARPGKPDAPGWKDNPAVTLGADVDKLRKGVDLNGPLPTVQPKLTPQQLEEEQKKKDAERRRDKGTDQVLGGRMVWNVLHLLRGDDLTDVQKRDAMNQLVVAGVLVLVLTGVLVGVLVWM